jgi:ATP dependent DNA ligase domain
MQVRPGNPVRAMLAQRLSSGQEILAKLGGGCAAEYKYDGVRVQVHRTADGQLELFTRRLERISGQFPDLVELLKAAIKPREVILEGEVVAFDPASGDLRPFQDVMFRRRKYGITEAVRDVPVSLFCFELLYADGQDHRAWLQVGSEALQQPQGLQHPLAVVVQDDAPADPLVVLGLFEDGDLQAQPARGQGGGESGRPGSHDGDPGQHPLRVPVLGVAVRGSDHMALPSKGVGSPCHPARVRRCPPRSSPGWPAAWPTCCHLDGQAWVAPHRYAWRSAWTRSGQWCWMDCRTGELAAWWGSPRPRSATAWTCCWTGSPHWVLPA